MVLELLNSNLAKLADAWRYLHKKKALILRAVWQNF